MKSVLMVALATFLLGLTGGVGYVFVGETRGSAQAHPLADSLTALAARTDSAAPAHADSAAAAHLGQLSAAGSPAPVEVDTTALPASADSASLMAAAAPAQPEMEPKRLAKLFGQMQPRDAVRVMAQMSDPEIQMILSLLGDRQASAILGSLPPERAAAVSRLVMSTNERTTP